MRRGGLFSGSFSLFLRNLGVFLFSITVSCRGFFDFDSFLNSFGHSLNIADLYGRLREVDIFDSRFRGDCCWRRFGLWLAICVDGQSPISGVEAAVFQSNSIRRDCDGGWRGDLGVLFRELLIEIIIERLAFDLLELGDHDGGCVEINPKASHRVDRGPW